MFTGRTRSCYAGGDHPGQRQVKEVSQDVAVIRPPCRRPPFGTHAGAAKSLVAGLQGLHGLHALKKTQSGHASGLHVVGVTRTRSRSVGDLSELASDLSRYARHFIKCRRVPVHMDRGGGSGGSWPCSQPGLLVGALGSPGIVGTAPSGTCFGQGLGGGSGALRACLLLMLNAWRARREEARVLRARVDQMRLQVTTLRALNKQETERASRAHLDAGRARTQGDAVRQQLDTLRTEHDNLGIVNATLETRLSEALTAAENLRNELHVARQEAGALEAQLDKERAKLADHREDHAQLREEMERKNALLEEAEATLRDTRSDFERVSQSAETNDEEVSRLTALCHQLQETLECEQHAVSQAQEALEERARELESARALLELERSPRRSAYRLLQVFKAPLGLLHHIYQAVCPYPYPSRSSL